MNDRERLRLERIYKLERELHEHLEQHLLHFRQAADELRIVHELVATLLKATTELTDR